MRGKRLEPPYRRVAQVPEARRLKLQGEVLRNPHKTEGLDVAAAEDGRPPGLGQHALTSAATALGTVISILPKTQRS